jgi:hypothetical protein
MTTLAKKWIGLIGVGMLCMSMVAAPAAAPKLVLWGKQTAGSGHAKNAKVEGNRLVLSKPAKIVKVEGDAKGYTIWSAVTPQNRTARALLSGGVGKATLVGQTLPAGTYTVLPGLYGMATARITITLEYGVGAVPIGPVPAPAGAPNLVLWGKQTAGSGHAKNAKVEGNRLALSKPAKIVKVEGDAKGYTIWSAVTPQNRTARAVLIGGAGKRSLVGQTLPAGTYTVLPGLYGMAAARITITLN